MNKKTVTSFFLITIAFITLNCENVDVIDVDISQNEYIVVKSELFAEQEFTGVTFTRTAPLTIPYDIKFTELKNVVSYIKINNVQIIPLHYTSNGLYKPLYKIMIKAGDNYELYAKIGDRYAYASTIIPGHPAIKSKFYNNNDYYFGAEVESYPNEVYGAVWVVENDRANNFFSVSSPDEMQDSGLVSTRTSIIPAKYRSSIYNNSRYFQVYAFDKPYLAYYQTYDNSAPIEDVFTQTSSKTSWNVKGNNVIGMFIGIAVSNLERP